MSTFDHRTRRERKKYREQLLRRYERQRQRNRLARPGRHAFIVVLDHLKAGYNVAKIFRSAEAFGAAEVQLIDIGPFDPAPSKGAFKQVPARFPASFDDSYRDLTGRGYRLFYLVPGPDVSAQATGVPSDSGTDHAAAEGRPGIEAPQWLTAVRFPRLSAFVLGHEERGLSFEPRAYDGLSGIRIRQFGQVESLNVSVAASLAMYEYTRQWSERE
jgi:tRNA G18 (ribose-2'-O)-methylase SpoU